ncbi:translation initiation factor eIF-2B subunit delta isoform X2 [Sitodiplosis mosellana]|nr:translation initiation factor eIF-2B subunit delta isoform X2 [Sitodiplosis mosellana]
MASKEKTTSASDGQQQQQQPVVADRDKVKNEREARRLAKLASKQKVQDKSRNLPNADEKKAEMKPDTKATNQSSASRKGDSVASDQNTHRKTQKHGKPNEKKESKPVETIANDLNKLKISNETSQPAVSDIAVEKSEKKQLSKAERRAIQEAQRAAKAAKTTEKSASKTSTKKESPEPKAGPSTGAKPKHENTPSTSREASARKPTPVKKSQQHRVKLFNHLYADISPANLLNSSTIHPAIVRLGVQYSSGIVKGCNARGLAFMSAIKEVIAEYQTPLQKEFSRSLEDVIKTCGNYLQQCRPLAVSVTNAMKFIQFHLRQLPKTESDAKQKATLLESIETYVRDQIDKAAEAISYTVQEKISDGDVILTFGCSSVILNILNEAKKNKDFRVIVVDARPLHEGREMLRRLVAKNIKCTCVLINAAGFIMPEVTKVLLGAHALLANGYVMSRAGTAQIALIAKSYNVPVLVCCETHKFSERVQTDAFVYNEIGNPYDVVKSNENNSPLANWESVPNLTPLNLYYDVTPPELVSAVVTEVAILPCTSVPVILRIKPSEIGY